MNILTLNTHSWQENETLNKLDILANAIIEQNCDLIALQEVNQHQDSTKIKDDISSNYQILNSNYGYLLQQKLAQLGHRYFLCWDFVHQSYEVYQEGVAFLTRLPILKHDVFDLVDNYDDSFYKHRRAQLITVRYQGKDVDFINCHCGWWADEDSPFEQQMDVIFAHCSSKLTFLLGDFNNPADVKDQGYDYILNHNFIDVYSLAQQKDDGFTVIKNIDGWSENDQKMRIDYIFVNQKIKVMSHKTIFNQDNYPIISDHFGIMAKVKIEN